MKQADKTLIAQDLITLIERVGHGHTLLPIRDIYVVPQEDDANNSNFGFIVLENDTVGLN